MKCFAPFHAWRSQEVNPATGKRGITFDFRKAYADLSVQFPCGKCIGCRVERSRSWALRIMHEAKLHESNSFVTLTYKEDPGEVSVRRLQLFFKQLRNTVGRFRYFAVGEYGREGGRPHYHAILFGQGFSDAKYWCGKGASRQSRSTLLESVWTDGNSTVGTVTSESAQYVAKYCIKLDDRVDDGRAREFAVMSRRPGIGAGWIDRYASSVVRRDFVVVDGGKRVGVPRYYLDRQPDVDRDFVKRERQRKSLPLRATEYERWDDAPLREEQLMQCTLTTIRKGMEEKAVL